MLHVQGRSHSNVVDVTVIPVEWALGSWDSMKDHNPTAAC